MTFVHDFEKKMRITAGAEKYLDRKRSLFYNFLKTTCRTTYKKGS